MDNFRCATRDIKEPLNLYLKKGLLVSFFGIFLPMRNVDLLKTIISFLSYIILHGNQFFIKKEKSAVDCQCEKRSNCCFQGPSASAWKGSETEKLGEKPISVISLAAFLFLGDQAESGRWLPSGYERLSTLRNTDETGKQRFRTSTIAFSSQQLYMNKS